MTDKGPEVFRAIVEQAVKNYSAPDLLVMIEKLSARVASLEQKVASMRDANLRQKRRAEDED